jgi:hypothetical protein
MRSLLNAPSPFPHSALCLHQTWIHLSRQQESRLSVEFKSLLLQTFYTLPLSFSTQMYPTHWFLICISQVLSWSHHLLVPFVLPDRFHLSRLPLWSWHNGKADTRAPCSPFPPLYWRKTFYIGFQLDQSIVNSPKSKKVDKSLKHCFRTTVSVAFWTSCIPLGDK